MTRPGFRQILLGTLAAALLLAPAAGAKITTTPYGGTTDARPGGHGTLTTGVKYKYDNTTETVKRILIDTPAGGVGNPNAVPYADRCTKQQFESKTCPAKSQIGVVTISATAYALGFIPIEMNDMTGTISQIQTTPEVPTLVGAYIQPDIGDPIRAYARYYPVTSGPDGDFRIRTETDDFPTTAKALGLDQRIQITKYEQKLFGKLANGNNFITNPTRCDTWLSGGYAEFYENRNGDSDPFQNGSKNFFKSASVPTEPDCTTLAPFSVAADAKLDNPHRNEHTGLSTELSMQGIDAEPQGAAVPGSVEVTLPAGVTIDVAQLGRVCSNEDFAADSCPPQTQVGSASITTPMISAGLQGSVHLVKASPGRNLPDLGVQIHGAINFSFRGSSSFVNGDQVRASFDALPPLGFSSFRLDLAGGPDGLLQVRQCPFDGSNPGDGGATHFVLTSPQGQRQEFDSPSTFRPEGCTSYRVTLKKPKRCVRGGSLKVRPDIFSPSEVRAVKYHVGGKYVKKAKHRPFVATLKLAKRLKLGRSYRLQAKVEFRPNAEHPKGRTVSRVFHFKRCR